MSELKNLKCEACRPDAPKVTKEQIAEYQPAIPDWELIFEDGVDKLKRIYKTKNYGETLSLVNKIADLAEEVDHHPVMLFEFRQLTVYWWSHEMSGLHVNDFILSARCDEAYENQ